MSAEFIDTNVFVYLLDEGDDRKRRIAEELVIRSLNTREAVISHQVVQETLSVLTTKAAVPLSASGARRFMERFLVPFWRIMPSPALYERALELQVCYRYGFYDSLIVAAALEAGCSKLYSEDFQPGQRIESLVIEDPFAESEMPTPPVSSS